ncbi:unnamed protein product [Trichobilharzia szidati]|nr:unnamed protein product [Trichobilharzia szidati]
MKLTLTETGRNRLSSKILNGITLQYSSIYLRNQHSRYIFYAETKANSFQVTKSKHNETTNNDNVMDKTTELQEDMRQRNETLDEKVDTTNQVNSKNSTTIKTPPEIRSFQNSQKHSSMLLTTQSARNASTLKTQQIHYITFKQADCYLCSQSLHLYEKFHLQFRFRTSQENGLLLFNSGKQGIDFLAFELMKGYLHFVFDMGSGTQRHALTTQPVTDSNWHHVELSRTDLHNNVVQLVLDRNTPDEQFLNISVINGASARNFNLNDPLYIGGVPQDIFLNWREKLNSYHGFQGCFGNFSINHQHNFDLLKMAKLKYSSNWTIPLCYDQIAYKCLDRPKDAAECSKIQQIQKPIHQKLTTNEIISGQHFQPYCLNDGLCLQTWTAVVCACELTSFDGQRCTEAGTTFLYDFDSLAFKRKRLLGRNDSILENNDNEPIGGLQFIYTDISRNTRQDEFVLGVQTLPANSVDKIKDPISQLYNNYISTLLFVTGFTQNGDFLHLFLESGIVQLNYNMGGGVVHISGPNFPIDDGFYHRIRGYRVDHKIILEVDDTRHTYELNSAYGKQFNNQRMIWLGHAPELNKSDFFRGYMSGVYYNGLMLNDLAAGMSYLPYIHVTRFPNVKYVTKFQPNLDNSNIFKYSSLSSRRIYGDSVSVGLPADRKIQNASHDEPIFDGINIDNHGKSFSSWQKPIYSHSLQLSDSVHITNDESFNPQDSNHNSLQRWQINETSTGMSEQINMWLLFTLISASLLIIIILITIVVYKFNHSKTTNSRSKPLSEYQPNSEQIRLSHSSITKRAPSISSILSVDNHNF